MTPPMKLRTLSALADAHDEHMTIVRMADNDVIDSVDFHEMLHRSEAHDVTEGWSCCVGKTPCLDAVG